MNARKKQKVQADEAVFMGTDDTERWTLEQFKSFALPYFEKGTGWTYTKRSRHIPNALAEAVVTLIQKKK